MTASQIGVPVLLRERRQALYHGRYFVGAGVFHF